MTSVHLTLEEALIFAAKNSEIDQDFSPCLSDDGNFIQPNIKAYHLYWPEDPEEFLGAMRIDMPRPDLKSSSSFFALYQEFRTLFANDTFELMGRLDSPVNELKAIPSSVANYLQPNNEDWSELAVVHEPESEVKKQVIYGHIFLNSNDGDKKSTSVNRGGRPPTYDWPRIADILSDEQLNAGLSFQTKKALYDYISALCENLWGKCPENKSIRIGLADARPGLLESLVDF